jgi:predicted PurR-regulated permease PerM/phosphoglycolate phosphatase-like HAD superfamily hydrolase
MTPNRWNTTTKIIVASLLSVFAIALLVTFRVMIRPTIIAFLLTFVLNRPVNWIQRRTGWGRAASIVLIYLLLLALVALTPAIIVPRLLDSFFSLRAAMENLVSDLQSAAPAPLLSFGQYDLSIEGILQQLGSILQDILSPAAAGAVGFALSLTTTVFATIYVLVITFWLLKDMNKLQRTMYELIPTDYSEEMRRLGQELAEIWYAFLRGQAILGLVVGIMTWIAMSIVGLPNAAGLALLAGVMEFLPTVGPGISGAIGTLVALFQGSTWLPVNNFVFALIVLAIYVVITQIESVYLIPRLVGRRVKLHPAITFAGIVSAALVFGFLGVLLATPTIASARSILRYIFRKLRDLEPFEPTYVQTGVRIPGLIAGHRIRAVLFDLDGVLVKVDYTFAQQMADRFARFERIWNREQRVRFFQRLMVFLESPINRWIGLLNWLQLRGDLQRLAPTLNRLRGFAPANGFQVFEGVPELLANLSRHYALGIITSRTASELDIFLQQLRLPPSMFKSTVTGEELHSLAPTSEALHISVKNIGYRPDECLIVNDTGLYLRTGQAMDMVTCGVLCGLGTQYDFADADLILQDVTELQDWL